MKVRDFIKGNYDVDVYNNVTEDWAICACCPIVLTEEGEKEWADVLDSTIDIYANFEALIDVDGEEGVWQERNRRAKKFFYSAAGYCSVENYKKWFKE